MAILEEIMCSVKLPEERFMLVELEALRIADISII